MADDVNKPRTASTWRRAAAALVGTAALGAVNAAEAHDWKRHRHHDAPIGYVVVPPGHVRYAAPAVVYAVPAPSWCIRSQWPTCRSPTHRLIRPMVHQSAA